MRDHVDSTSARPVRRMFLSMAVLLATGCPENFPIPGILDTDTGPDTGTAPITKVNSDLGYISIVQTAPHLGRAELLTEARGVFLVNNYDILNPAECFSNGTYCVVDDPPTWNGFPTEVDGQPTKLGEPSGNDDFREDNLDQLTTIDVVDQAGDDKIALGPLEMNEAKVQVDVDEGQPERENTIYSKDFADLMLPDSTEVLTLELAGGAWGNRTLDTVAAPTPMNITSHDPMSRQEFLSTEPITLTWDPGEIGEVYLQVITPNAMWLQLVEDDGEHVVPTEAFFLQEDDELEIVLGRWSMAAIDVDGHTLDVQIQHNQQLTGVFTALGDRVELDDSMLYDDCAEAEGAPFLSSGIYFGDLAGYRNDYVNMAGRDGQPCLTAPAEGPDAVIPVRLQADELLQVEFLQRDDDAVLYLVENLCEGPTPVCLQGVNEKFNRAQEALAYRNNSGAPLDLWVILDSVQPQVDDLFELNIGLEASLENPLQSSCADAVVQGPIDEGNYFGFMGSFPNLNECVVIDPPSQMVVSETPLPGGDGKAEVYLLPGETLTAEVFAPGGAPSMYLLYNCALSESCLANPVGNGMDDTVSLTYTNSSGVSEHLFLVVDSGINDTTGTVQEYFLDIEIQ